MPPPSTFLVLLASLINETGPTITLPTGAPRPFERHTEMVSAAATKLF
jgi:hypothetical protein